MLNNMYMAAIILINHALVLQHHGSPTEKDIRWIRLLVEKFAQVQLHFPIASRMCQVLSQIIRGTSLASLLKLLVRAKVNKRASAMSPLAPVG